MDLKQIEPKIEEYVLDVGGEEYMDEETFLAFLEDDKLEPLAYITRRRAVIAFQKRIDEYLKTNL